MTRTKRVLAGAAMVALVTPILASVAQAAAAAASAAEAPLPYGQWFADALTGSEATITLIVSALIFKYVPAFYRVFLTQKVISDAVHYAIASVAGAAYDKVWSIATTNEVIGQAEAFVIANEKKYADLLGALLRPKIVAAVAAWGTVPAAADAASLNAELPHKAA